MANFNKNTNVYDSRYNKVKGKRNEEASKMKRTGSENLADREKTITAKYSRDVAAVQDFVDTFVDQSKVVVRDNNSLVLKTSHNPFNRVEESNAAKRAIDILNTNKFFNKVVNNGNPNNMNLKYHNLANINTTTSYQNITDVYSKYQSIIKNNGTIIGYDLETLGGMSDGIWNPLGITEFGINIQQIVNGEVAKTTSENIMLTGNVNHAIELNKIKKVLESKNGAKKLKEDPRYQGLLVSAKRYSMYGHADSKMHFDAQKGYAVIDSFAGEAGEAWGNIEQITEGVNRFIEMEKLASQAIDEKTGLRKDVKASLDYIFNMMETANDESGLVVGHNIRGFDNAALNQYVKKIYNSNKSAQEYITERMGTLGMNTPGFHLGPIAQADSLNFSRIVNNKDYMGVLLDVSDRGREILSQAGRGVNKQENIGAVFFPHLFEGAMAHSAGNDTAVVNAFFTHRFTEEYLRGIGIDEGVIDNYKGKTLIEAMNDMINQHTYDPVDIKANRQQIFMANKTMNGSFGGKKIFNFTQDSRGQIVTSTGHVITPDGDIEYNPVHGKQIGVVRNQPYTIVNYGAINTSQYSGELANLVPEFANDEAYYLNLEQVVGDKYKSRTRPTRTTMVFSNKEEMEGFIDSFLTPFAESTGDGYKYIGNRRIAESYAKQYILTEKGTSFDNDKWTKMFESEQIKESLNSNFKRRYEKKAAENFLFGDKSAKRIGESLDLLDYLRKNNLSEITANDLGRIYYGESGMTIGDVVITPGRAKDIRETMRGIFGFKPKDKDGKTINKKVLLDATADNAIASFEHVKAQEQYYRNSLNTVLKAHNIDPNNYKNYRSIISTNRVAMNSVNYDFIALNDALSVTAANVISEASNATERTARNLALNTKNQVVPKSQIDNMYEFRLGKSFYSNKKAQSINSLAGPEKYQNVIQYNLDSADPGMNFIDRLIKIQTGTTRQLTETERIQSGRQVFHQFVTQELIKDERLKENEEIGKLLKYVQEDDYNLRRALSYLEKGISGTREVYPDAGVIRTGGRRGVTSTYRISKYKNEMAPEVMQGVMEGLGKTIDVSSSNNRNRRNVVNELVNRFVVDEKTFNDQLVKLHGENANAVSDTMLAYHKVREQYGAFFNDLLNSASSIDVDLILNQKTGELMAKRGDKIIDLNNIPKIKSDNGALYAISGNKKSAIHHVIEYNKAKNVLEYRTNLDDEFGGMRDLSNRIKRQLERGEVDLDTFRREIGKLKSDFEDSPVYQYKQGNMLVGNSQIDLRGVDPIYPELFKEDGTLRSVVSQMSSEDKLNVLNIQNIMERKIPESLEWGGLDPIQRAYIGPDLIPILQEVNRRTSNDPTVARILSHINATGKETKVTKGIYDVNTMYIPQGSGYLDNYGRPVSVSAFNRNWIRANTIEEASKTYQNLLIGSRVIDSKEIHKNIYKNVREVGNLTADFSVRQLNMSNQNIAALVEYKRNEAINYVIDNYKNHPEYSYIAANAEKIMAEVEHIAKDTVFEQGKLMDPALFEMLMGDTPQNVQNISFNLNAIPAIQDILEGSNPEELIKTKIPQMREMFGELTRDEKGRYVYSKAPGTIVKRGETIFPYKAFGDIDRNLGSKFPEGVLSLKFRNKEGIELTEEEISNIINDTFGDSDINIKDVLKLFTEHDEFKAAYEIAHVSQEELPKTFSNSAEKSMTRVPYVKAGRYDERIKGVLTESGKGNWVDSIILRNDTLDAWYNDMIREMGKESADDLIRKYGFKTIDDMKNAAEFERLVYQKFAFGENGIFGKVSMVANDNVPGHENMGHQMSSALGEAIRLTGKYTIGEEGTENEYWEAGIRKVSEMIAANPEEFGFLKELDKSKGIDKSKAMDISNNLTLLFSTNMYDKDKKGIEVLDTDKLVNLFREIDKTILKDAPEEDRLVHTDLEGIDEIVGAIKTIEVGGKKYAIGSTGVTSTSFAIDSEVQSGVSQEYLDAKKALRSYTNQLDAIMRKKPSKRTDKEIELLETLPEKIDILRDQIDAMADSSRFMKIDDQLRNILGNSALDSTTERQLSNIVKNSNDPYGMTKLIEQASDKMINRNADGEFEIGRRYKTANVNKPWLDDVKQQITYNPLEERELTEKMLKLPEYKHLEPLYDEVVRKRGMKLGVDSAELFHEGRLAYAAAQFNSGGNIQIEDLLDKGIQIVAAEDYIGNLGKASAGDFVSSYAKDTILLDLGENYAKLSKSGKRYVAVPGLGNIVKDEEIKREWQKTAGALASTWQDWADIGFNDTKEGQRLIGRMDDLFDQLNSESQHIIRKGSVFADKAKVQYNAPAQRVKIQATLGNEVLSTPLLEKIKEEMPSDFVVDEDMFRNNAMILGKPIAEWEKNGPQGSSLYFNYRTASEEDFANKGYFNIDFMKQMGFKETVDGKEVPIVDENKLREKMMDYLSTHGTMDVIDRYPNIYDTSALSTITFLDRTLSGNASALSGHSLLLVNGDLDGDLTSTIKLSKGSINYALYNKHREDARAQMNKELKANNIDIDTLDKDAIEDNLRRNTIKSWRANNVNGSNDELNMAYDFFRSKELEAVRDAATNVNYVRDNVMETLAKDSGRAYKSMALSVDGKDILAEVEGGRSSLGRLRTFNRRDHVEAGELFKSDEQLKGYFSEALDILNNQPELFKGEEFKFTEGMKEIAAKDSTKTIATFGNKQREALDEMLYVLQKGGSSLAGEAETAVLERIQQNKYMESLLFKGSKNSIGLVNAQLYAMKQSSENYFSQAAIDTEKRLFTSGMDASSIRNSSELKDIALKRGNISLFASGIEQDIISAKKVKMYAGDERFMSFGGIMQNLRSGRGTQENREDFLNWFERYGKFSTVSNKFDDWVNDGTISESMVNKATAYIDRYKSIGLEDAEERGKAMYLAEHFYDTVDTLYKKNESFKQDSNLFSVFGRSSGSVDRMIHVEGASGESHSALIQGLISNQDISYKAKDFERTSSRVMSDRLKNINDFQKFARASNETLENIVEGGKDSLLASPGAILGFSAIGLAVGVAAAGYAGGPLKKSKAVSDEKQQREQAEQRMTVPEFFDSQGGYVTGNSQQGYIININANTNKGERHMKRAMKEAVSSSVGGAVSINMNFKSNSTGGWSDRDIEKIINNYM